MDTLEILLCFTLLGISAFFSASEVALFSLSRSQLRYFKVHVKGTYRRIRKLLSDPGGLLATVLVSNELVNIVLSSIIAHNIGENFTSETVSWLSFLPIWAQQTLAGIIITAPLLLIFGEITPKGIASRINQILAPLSSRPMLFIYYMITPIRVTLNWIFRTTQSSDEIQKEQRQLKEEELLMMVEEGLKEGEFHQRELQLIRNVLFLDDQTVDQVYTPLSKVTALSEKSTIEQVFTLSKNYRFGRIPIFHHQNRKQIVGILYLKDLLNDRLSGTPQTESIEPILRKPLITQPQMKLNALFRRFKQTQTHIAVVEDEAKQTLGIVTLDDVIESLFEGVLEDDENLEVKP